MSVSRLKELYHQSLHTSAALYDFASARDKLKTPFDNLYQPMLHYSYLYSTLPIYDKQEQEKKMPRFRWEEYVDAFKSGEIWTRVDLANKFGVGRSTARYHLERAVKAGALNKQYGWTGSQSGWLYALPCTMPRLEGV